MLLHLIISLLLLTGIAHAKTENPTSDVLPVSAYGTTSGGVIVPLLVASDGKVVTSGGGAGSNYWSLNGGTGNVGISTINSVGIGTTIGSGRLNVYGVQTGSIGNGLLGVGTFNPIGTVHVRKESAGVTPSVLDSNGIHYSVLAEGEDAVVGLYSYREGGHGSTMEWAEMEPGSTTLNDKWALGRTSSNIGIGTLSPGSSIYYSYGNNASYVSNQVNMEITKFGQLRIGVPISNDSSYITNNSSGFFNRGSSITNAMYDSNALRGLVTQFLEGRIQIISDDGGSNNTAYMLSSAPATGPNKHWAVHHRGTAQNNRLDFQYGTSTASGDILAGLSTFVGIGTTGNVGIGTTQVTTGGLLVMNGNVGIGTWKPESPLSIKGPALTQLLTGANTACTTTCGAFACYFGTDTGVLGTINDCANASSDACICSK